MVDCDLSDKKIVTRAALDKHMYTHNDLHFVCEDCGQSFPFKSRLEQHRITHQSDPSFMCQHKGCDHCFKNKGDLNRHLHSHDDLHATKIFGVQPSCKLSLFFMKMSELVWYF